MHAHHRLAPFSPLVALSLVARCLPAGAPREPAPRLVHVALAPDLLAPADALDALPRVPTLALQFDRPLSAPASDDAVWLLRVEDPLSALSDARRGALSATRSSLRVPLDLSLDPDDPSRIYLHTREVLDPSLALSLVTTVHLRGLDGSAALDAPLDTATPVLRALRTARSSACPPIARVVFPYPDALPPGATRMHIAFDRPVHLDAPRATLAAPDAAPLALALSPACPDPLGGFRCLALAPPEPLLPSTRYALTLTGLRDDDNREAQLFPPSIATLSLDDDAHPALHTPPTFAPTRCADDELALGPACVLFTHDALELRASLTHDGALLARAGDALVLSSASRTHTLLLPYARPLRVQLRPLALDGTAGPVFDLPELAPLPDAPAPRIDEVHARPHAGSSQEFVELVNDHPQPAPLAGLVLTVGALSTPPFSDTEPPLAPYARVVIAGSTYDPRGARGPDGADPPLAPDARLLRLASSRITSVGLTDRGSVLTLRTRDGVRVSLFPGSDPSLAPRAGAAIHRADPRRAQDDPLAWAYDPDARSTPGAPTRAPP